MIAGDIDLERAVWDPDYRRDLKRFLESEARAETSPLPRPATHPANPASIGRTLTRPRRLAAGKA